MQLGWRVLLVYFCPLDFQLIHGIRMTDPEICDKTQLNLCATEYLYMVAYWHSTWNTGTVHEILSQYLKCCHSTWNTSARWDYNKAYQVLFHDDLNAENIKCSFMCNMAKPWQDILFRKFQVSKCLGRQVRGYVTFVSSLFHFIKWEI